MAGEIVWRFAVKEPDKPLNDQPFFGRGSDVRLHLYGSCAMEPFQRRLFDEIGYALNHIDHRVEDIEAAFENLVSMGLEPRCEPSHLLDTSYTVLMDPNNRIFVELNQWREVGLGETDLDIGSSDIKPHYISIVTDDISDSPRTYKDFLG